MQIQDQSGNIRMVGAMSVDQRKGGSVILRPNDKEAWAQMEVVLSHDEVDALRALPTPCSGCGSVETLAAIQARGFLSCCPDRQGAPSYIEVGGLCNTQPE